MRETFQLVNDQTIGAGLTMLQFNFPNVNVQQPINIVGIMATMRRATAAVQYIRELWSAQVVIVGSQGSNVNTLLPNNAGLVGYTQGFVRHEFSQDCVNQPAAISFEANDAFVIGTTFYWGTASAANDDLEISVGLIFEYANRYTSTKKPLVIVPKNKIPLPRLRSNLKK